jgi:hypothetical protein
MFFRAGEPHDCFDFLFLLRTLREYLGHLA